MGSKAQCGSCGESNPSDSAFCLMCGAYLGWDEPGKGPVEKAAPVVGPVPPSPGAGSPPPSTSATESASATRQRPVASERSAGAAPVDRPPCPACGHPIKPGLRFCGHCGHVLVAVRSAQAPPPTSGSVGHRRWLWWGRDPQDRAARRAYRRSLPALYRWRRVIVGVLIVVLLGTLVGFLTGDPVERVRALWYDVTDTKVQLRIVSAVAVPEGSAVLGSAPTEVLDHDADTAWETSWDPDAPAPESCEGRGGGIRFTWEGDAEVRQLRVRAGLSEGNTRTREYIPQVLALRYDGTCTGPIPIQEVPEWQTVPVKLEAAVTSVTLVVLKAARGGTEPELRQVALRDVQIFARPR